MKDSRISSIKGAGVYIGTVVGAGFASGQEILQFFITSGIKGLIGLILTTFFLIVFGYYIMDIGNSLVSHSHYELINFVTGRYLGTLVDCFITLFLFISFTAMVAGAGATFYQQFHLPSIWGNLLMALLSAFTVLTGIKGVINAISFVVPFLILAVLGISLVAIIKHPLDLHHISTLTLPHPLLGNWLLSSLLYASYNLILSISILGPLGAEINHRPSIKKAALLGGLGLGVSAIFIYLALISSFDFIKDLEVPMLYISSYISYVFPMIYAVILIAEIYTTAVGSLYGFIARMTTSQQTKIKTYTYLTICFAFLASQWGFSNIIKYLYPIVGYVGLLLLIALAIAKRRISIKK